MKKRRVLVIPLITLVIMTTLAAIAPAAHADGGDFSLDFIAAGPFTYDHDTGVGGEYADRTISKTEGVVESLEGGDFACGDRVVYFTQIVVDAGASGAQDIELDYEFLAETTGQPGAGHDSVVSATRNVDDPGETASAADTDVTLVEQHKNGAPKETLFATIRVENLDPGEEFILRIVTVLDCLPGEDPTGNLQADIVEGRVIAPEADAIPVGNQTIPFFRLDLLAHPASVAVTVGECPRPGSPTVPVTIDIAPPGSATVTITGNGVNEVVDGSGGTLDLAPGTYTWTAEREPGYFLDGPSSGTITVPSCPRLPASVTIRVGPCPAPGADTRPVEISLSPEGKVSVTITGPNGFNAVVNGSGQTLDLAPGTYHWEATVNDDRYELGTSSGDFTVGTCPTNPASVSVSVGACPGPAAATVPVTVTITPGGSASVTITGPGGFNQVVTSTTTLDLAPGDYAWSATPDDEHHLTSAANGTFSVPVCPAVLSSVTVTVGACPATSSTTKPVAVSINPDGAASVDIDGPNGYHTTVTGTGATLDLAKGDYTWTATENEGFSIIGASAGTFTVGSCVVQVLPKTILPKTGSSAPSGLGAIGFGFLLLGVAMVAASRRAPRAAVSAGISTMASRLSGRLSGRMTWTESESRINTGPVIRSPEVRDPFGDPRRRVAGRRGFRIGRTSLGEG